MTMRFRPANGRVINRRVCSSAVIGPAVQNQTRSKLTSRNVPRYAARREYPERQNGLTVKGSLRRAKMRLALGAARRSGRIAMATGGSGGNTSRARTKPKGRLSSRGGKPA
jgi:hypothetical protein